MESKVPAESSDPMKQILQLIEKKIRNLEKRKSRLDAIREKARDRDSKVELNEEQKEAMEKYDSVVQNIEFVKELLKSITSLVSDHEKQMKKQQKKERMERAAAEHKRFRELLEVQSLLDGLGDEKIRKDFLHGTNGATMLNEQDLDHLDNLYQLISPTREEASNYEQQLTEAAEHVSSLLDGRERTVGNTTYAHLNQLIERVRTSNYFNSKRNGTSHNEASQQVVPDNEKEADASQEVGPERLPKETSPSAATSHPNEPASTASHVTTTSYAAGDNSNKSQVAPSFGSVTASSFEQPYYAPTSHYQPLPQRPLQEIVPASPFNFLQDSEIDKNEYVAGTTFDTIYPGTTSFHSQSLPSGTATYGQAFIAAPDHGLTSQHFAPPPASESYSSLATSLASATLGSSGVTSQRRTTDVTEGKKAFPPNNTTANAFPAFPGNEAEAALNNFSTQSQTFVNSNLAANPAEGAASRSGFPAAGQYADSFHKKTNTPNQHGEPSFGHHGQGHQGHANVRGGAGYGSYDRRGRGGYHRDNDYDGRNNADYTGHRNMDNNGAQRGGAHRGGGGGRGDGRRGRGGERGARQQQPTVS